MDMTSIRKLRNKMHKKKQEEYLLCKEYNHGGQQEKDQLVVAIRAGDLVNLRALLSQRNLDGRLSVTEKDIDSALWWAALEGSVESGRLLWERLSRRGRQKYFARINDVGLLHAAVMNGHLHVVRFFIQECKFNANQQQQTDVIVTPLNCATNNPKMTRFLLENGANVNLGGRYGPLYAAVCYDNAEVVRLLLQYNANPNLNRRPANEEEEDEDTERYRRRCTDIAILNGSVEILRILLQHGAFLGIRSRLLRGAITSLNELLRDHENSVQTKMSIPRLLVEHANKRDHATAAFMQQSLEIEIKSSNAENEHCAILLEAGMDSTSAMYMAIQAGNISLCQFLVQVYRVDPFLQDEDGNEDEDEQAASPFLAAARLPNTRIFEYFLRIWDETFSSNGGKNSEGDFPIHVACCDPLVSLQAIKILVNRQADSLAVVNGEEGLLPFHFAANWGASLDVIFYLLQHCPDALSHVGNSAASSASRTNSGPCPDALPNVGTRSGCTFGLVETNSDDNKQQRGQNDLEGCGPAQKKTKTTHSGKAFNRHEPGNLPCRRRTNVAIQNNHLLLVELLL